MRRLPQLLDIAAAILCVSLCGLTARRCRPVTPPPAPLEARIHVLGEPAQVGFDAPFEIRVEPDSASQRRTIVWRPIEGEALAELSVDSAGYHLRGRTKPLAALRSGVVPWGIVPLSPRTQGEVVLEATWSGEGVAHRSVIRLAAAARATGVPTLAVGQRVYLGGQGWHVVSRPLGSSADVQQGELDSFEPDVAGRWRLADADGKELRIGAGAYDEIPLDCGSSKCHPTVAAEVEASPMTHVLERGLNGAFGVGFDPRCAIRCHASGQPGLHDGGFADVAQQLGFALPSAPSPGLWSSVPRALRRLGGVGCMACHGPGAIPERKARTSILRSDVCAVCHDAPPRYMHVVSWGASRMARSDADARTRSEPACAACHTTAGFLGVRSAEDMESPAGIACAACHAPHAGGNLVRHVVLRRAVDAADLPSATRICIGCHSPKPDTDLPSASAAALWLGRDGRRAWGVDAPSPHRAVVGGCVGCHSGSASAGPDVRGSGHDFRADLSRCLACHTGGPPVEQSGRGGQLVQEHARALWARITTADDGVVGPIHANARAAGDSSANMRRALWNVALVLEDPAAATHNAPFARRLLDEAEDLVSGIAPETPAVPVDETGGPAEASVTFTTVYTTVLSQNPPGCTDHHAGAMPAGGLDLSTQGAAYASLVGVRALGPACGRSGRSRVVPGNAADSLFYQKVAGAPACGAQMPRDGLPLSAGQVQVIRDWINAGAQND